MQAFDEKPFLDELGRRFNELLRCPKLRRGETWKGQWPGWDEVTWQPTRSGVYVLWQHHDDLKKGARPVYVGEGIIGTRIWDSFNGRPTWSIAQILYDEVTWDACEAMNQRRLLERFAIVVLKPIENLG